MRVEQGVARNCRTQAIWSLHRRALIADLAPSRATANQQLRAVIDENRCRRLTDAP